MSKKRSGRKEGGRAGGDGGRAGPPLDEYAQKRDFDRTPEPAGEARASETGRLYAMQKHRAHRLHYDLRLELDGVLLSWAVPKGPSLDPTVKSLAVRTEDHPIEYGEFEGIIPEGDYGGGAVMVWDYGEWEPINEPRKALEKGDLKFRLYGEKLGGAWALVRMEDRDWLLIKKKDDAARARAEYNVLNEDGRSALSGRTIEEIASDADTSWEEGRAVARAERAKGKRRGPGRLDPSGVAGAKKASQPEVFRPQLAESARVAPDGDEWIHEVKYDGYRLVSVITDGRVRLLTRNGHDWTDRFANLPSVLARLPVHDAVLDGEVVVLDAAGVPDFGALQRAFRRGDRAGFVYYLFDVMHAGGYDLTGGALKGRKAYLERLLRATPGAGPVLRFSEHFEGRGRVVAAEASKHGMEGIVSKRADSAYLEGKRSSSWLKVKFRAREEFAIGGYTEPEGAARTGFGALVVGRYDDAGRLVCCGRVGTGFGEAVLRELGDRMHGMRQTAPSFANPPTGVDARGVVWIAPELVCEVEYGSWTHEGMLRHGVFLGLREDKVAREVVGGVPRRSVADTVAGTPPVVRLSRGPGDVRIGGVRISSPGRTVYPETGHTKGDVARYYEAAAEWILAFVRERPLSVVRCPEGVEGEHFFQKHVGEGFPAGIEGTPIADRGVKHPYLTVRGGEGLLSLAQMGVLEIHMWGSRLDRPERPDLIVFDLDPGPGIVWEHVVESAKFVRDHLRRLGLESFAKTSGGAGMHVVVPVVRRAGWDEVKGFARAVAEDLVRVAPQNFVATMAKTRREHRIFIDYLRNARGATAVAPYSTRALPLATVSTPLRWSEVGKKLSPKDLNITTVARRLARLKSDPWQGFFGMRQSITREMRRAVGME